MKNKIGLFSLKSDGHRSDYNKFLMSSLDNAELVSRFDDCDVMIFMMIEESFFEFSVISLFRALRGKKTSGFLFRLKPVASPNSTRLYVKGLILKFLRLFKSIRVFSIHDPTILQNGSDYVSDWIYDFQLWDLFKSPIYKEVHLARSSRINKLDSDPMVIVALGTQDENKGIIDLIDLVKLRNSSGANFSFRIYGKLHSKYAADLLGLIDGRDCCVNDYVSDEMLWKGYKEADLIWAFYSSAYDQASGVAGRAAQFDVPVIVRENSIISNVLMKINAKVLPIKHSSEILKITKSHLIFNDSTALIESVRESSLSKLMKLTFRN